MKHPHEESDFYPQDLVERVCLADGAPLTIRPIRCEDAERERLFVRELSPETRRFRFLHTLDELTPAMLACFTRIDYSRDMALVAMLDDADGPKQVGVARYFSDPDGAGAEFAIVVADALQGRGIGPRLMRSLMHAARQHRLARLHGESFADNHCMLRLMQELGFDMVKSLDDHHLVKLTCELRQGTRTDDSCRSR